MIAAEYGYEVLPGVALDTPGVEDVLRRRERALRWGLVALTVEVLLLAAVLSPLRAPAPPRAWSPPPA
ncbi:hypothetical protein [Streptomyces iakyrus]|uniref:hypothetical protein n=1 Tax=Streptomyces iakyrus TaxID=68219 RepID=UPI0036FDC19E